MMTGRQLESGSISTGKTTPRAFQQALVGGTCAGSAALTLAACISLSPTDRCVSFPTRSTILFIRALSTRKKGELTGDY